MINKQQTTAAAINASVNLYFATHYCCTSGGCGNPLCNISGWAEIGPARNKKNKFVINYFEEKYY